MESKNDVVALCCLEAEILVLKRLVWHCYEINLIDQKAYGEVSRKTEHFLLKLKLEKENAGKSEGTMADLSLEGKAVKDAQTLTIHVLLGRLKRLESAESL